MCPEAPGSLLSTRCRCEIPGEEGAQPGNSRLGLVRVLGAGEVPPVPTGEPGKDCVHSRRRVGRSPGILFGEGPTRPQSSAEGHPSAKSPQPRPALHTRWAGAARLPCAWGSAGENTGVCCRARLQAISPARGWSPCRLRLLPRPASSPALAPPEKPLLSRASVPVWIQTEPGFRFQLSRVPAG